MNSYCLNSTVTFALHLKAQTHNCRLEVAVSETQNHGVSQSKKCNTSKFLIYLFPYLLRNTASLLDVTYFGGDKNK